MAATHLLIRPAMALVLVVGLLSGLGPVAGPLGGGPVGASPRPATVVDVACEYLGSCDDPAPTDEPPVVPTLIVASTLEDTPVVISIPVTDDGDPDGLTYRYPATGSTPAHGMVGPAGPSITYSPAGDSFGTDTFSVEVDDGVNEPRVAVVNVVITSVNDPPVLAALPAEIMSETTGPSGATVISFLPTGTDVDGTNPIVSCTPASGSTFPIGTTIGICTATDTGGLTVSGRFTVRVADATGPTITWFGGPQPNRSYPRSSLPGEPTCTATDAVSEVTQCRVHGYRTASGNHTLTARARDSADNSSVSTGTYIVTEGAASTATGTPLPPRPTATPVSTLW